MVYCFYQAFDAVFNFNLNFSGHFCHVRWNQSRLRKVALKVLVKSVRHIFYLIVDVFFFMVKLNETEGFQVFYQFFGRLLKAFHFGAVKIFLLQNFISCNVQSFIENFKDRLNLALVLA